MKQLRADKYVIIYLFGSQTHVLTVLSLLSVQFKGINTITVSNTVTVVLKKQADKLCQQLHTVVTKIFDNMCLKKTKEVTLKLRLTL